jgi:hypothetical protein
MMGYSFTGMRLGKSNAAMSPIGRKTGLEKKTGGGYSSTVWQGTLTVPCIIFPYEMDECTIRPQVLACSRCLRQTI